MHDLELWGGHECTVNRLDDAFMDQTVLSGHHERLSDLDLFADLGVKALRYPVLWERTAPDHPGEYDWRWADERLGRLAELRIKPIVGLVHHGSGPRYTSLLDDGFATGLAQFARAVAERYPWVGDWTPINEPLTTARFSALYGLWYPHVRDEALFWRALLNQIDGIRLAMREIRAVNPAARLIQTEDLGKTYSTRAVSHQASFDNARRWMTWDLLMGAVTPGHPMWERLEWYGLAERLRAIADEPCAADVIGVNHYLTRDRFLDHRAGRYPRRFWGGNEFMRFADVEAVRVLQPGPDGLEGALQEAWSRYGRTLAVTEAHNGCTREDQMRWFREAWTTGQRMRARGVPVEAVTAWSLLGSYDWNSLLTKPAGHYECGVFDMRCGEPRPTAVSAMLKSLGNPLEEPHPVLATPGWWRRDVRLQHKPVFRTVEDPEPRRQWQAPPGPRRPLLITGATGTLGKALARSCEWRGIDYVLTDRSQLSLADEDSIDRALDHHVPWAVVNAAGWVRVDDAEADPDGCIQANAEGALRLARACHDRDLAFAGFSSDLVFDGRPGRPYVESDAANPLNVYGRSKAQAEAAVLALGGKALMIRTAAFFSPYDPWNFAAWVTRSLADGQEIAVAEDLVVSPTYVPDLVDATLDLLIDGEAGVWHLANQGEVTWAQFAAKIADLLDLDQALIAPSPWKSLGWPAARPAHAPLASERGCLMPTLENALERYAGVMRDSAFEGEASRERAPAPARNRKTRA
ncbi:MAG TPA: family 1 glycosylhydrolase [Caulobacteraceae bacterium]|nr:family 1 glycosylhydrolase [Caulobacteraceae bacterium]